MAAEMVPIAQELGFLHLATIHEDASGLESHGRTARGGTAIHEVMFLRSSSRQAATVS
jgi:hypothetical protein